MQSKRPFGILTAVYSLIRRAGLLERSWTRRWFVSAYFLYKRFWEDPFWELIRRRPELFANGDVLDIGANIGYTACLFARVLTPGAKVYAFEPDQTAFQLLTEVIGRKHLEEKIETLHSAVGSSDGSLEFWHNERLSTDHRVATGHFRASLPDPAQIWRVPVLCVDSFVRARGLCNISFLKMDVQGYELAVCEGMKETLARFPDLSVCFEYAPLALRELGFEPLQVLAFFRTRGYQLHILTRSGTQWVRDDAEISRRAEAADYVDLLCSRQILS